MIFTQMYAHDDGPWYLREIGDESSRMIQCIRQTSVRALRPSTVQQRLTYPNPKQLRLFEHPRDDEELSYQKATGTM
jgi:hypothetical protein